MPVEQSLATFEKEMSSLATGKVDIFGSSLVCAVQNFVSVSIFWFMAIIGVTTIPFCTGK